MQQYSLEVSGLRKAYTRRIIFENVSFRFDGPGIFGVAGANGSGKSTLVKIIAGLLLPTQGKIIHALDGKPVPEEETLPLVGFASPYLNFYEEFSAEENIRMLTAIRGQKIDHTLEKSLFDHFGIYDRRTDAVKAYSSGMKQRLRLIFAFIHSPSLVILDEPVSNLDTAGKEQVYSLVKQESGAKTMIIASNDESDLALCSTILNIEEFKRK